MDDIDELWKTWNTSQSPDDFNKLMTATSPVIDSAIVSYANGASPAIRSTAKVLTAKALKTFDPTKKTKLRTYLHTQLQPIQREAGTYSTVYAPEKVRFDLSKLKQLNTRFFDENGRDPNEDELSDFTGLSRKRIKHIRTFDRRMLGEGALEETSDSGAGMPKMQEAAFLWEDYVYNELGDLDKKIYDLKTGRGGMEPIGTSEIARKLRITAGAISQRLSKIAERIAEGKQLEQNYGKPV